MARLPTLLEHFKSLCKKQIEIAVELETVEREMLAVETGKPASASTRPARNSECRPSPRRRDKSQP